MPGFDGSGPKGKGPMTGRGSGYCAIPLNTIDQKLEFLKNREQGLKQQLKQAKVRIKRIEVGKNKRRQQNEYCN